MQTFLSLRLQAALVAILFVGSIGALVFNVFSALVPRERELQVREQLREVSQKMAVAAAASWPSLREMETRRPEEVDRRLVEIGSEAMAAYPDVEGGFYLNSSVDRFSGFAQGSAKRPPPDRRVRNEPPPMESPLIRVQAQQSLNLAPGQFLLNIRDVGPSRVAVLTEPVGVERPASLATWVMFRLVDPKDIGVQLLRYQLSIGLAFAGLASAVLLAWNMGRMIRRQNIEQSRLQQELRRSEHLAALGTLLAGVAHEVRNPLAAIRSTVQLWQRLPDTAQNPNSLTAVVRAVDRINEIVSQLLQFSRTSGDERETVDVRHLLDETLNLVSAKAHEQSVAIERHFDGHPAMISASGQALRQVFLNLATNALQAMPNGGTLRCCETRKDRTVEITFADTGPGVSVEDRAHLFEPFFTTRADGTGLGLAICREIITQHDGHIELVSDNSPGATFRIVLPVDHSSAAQRT
jgi:signal transduction histidine kinase